LSDHREPRREYKNKLRGKFMSKRLFLSGWVAWLIVFSGKVLSDSEATYNPSTRSLHVPKISVDAHYYDVDFQQGEGLNFLLTAIAPSASSASSGISTYNSVIRAVNMPIVMIGGDSYMVDMQQGQELDFTVTNTKLINAYFNPIDVFELAWHHSGGSRFNSITVTENSPFINGSKGCGYGYQRSRAETEQNVLQSGGSVVVSNFTEWCGSLAGQTACIKAFDRLLVSVEPWSPQQTITTLYMTDLLPDHWTEIEFDNLAFNAFGAARPETNVSAVSRDTSVGEGANCDISAQPTQSNEAINGVWVGYKATYSPSTMTGSTSPATLSCVSQVCTINALSGATSVNLSIFDSTKLAWAADSGAPKMAGAAITGDGQLLSMYICNVPLDKATAFDNCSFFTFKR
jgi:hypothetical protein